VAGGELAVVSARGIERGGDDPPGPVRGAFEPVAPVRIDVEGDPRASRGPGDLADPVRTDRAFVEPAEQLRPALRDGAAVGVRNRCRRDRCEGGRERQRREENRSGHCNLLLLFIYHTVYYTNARRKA